MSPAPSYLHQRLRYEPATGRLCWRHYEPHGARWNNRWAGREAFTALTSNGYKQGKLDGATLTAHRVVWAMHHGAWPGMLDHRDKDKTNNRVSNLRLSDNVRNGRNIHRPANNSSGVVGVRWDAERGKWFAYITVRGTMANLGRYEDFDAAVDARKEAERAYGFDPTHGSERPQA